MLQLKFAESPASMMVWRVRCTGPEYPSVGSAAPGAGTSGMFFSVTTFMALSIVTDFLAVPSARGLGFPRHGLTDAPFRRHANFHSVPKGRPDEIRTGSWPMLD
jgi:hypothetical protein